MRWGWISGGGLEVGENLLHRTRHPGRVAVFVVVIFLKVEAEEAGHAGRLDFRGVLGDGGDGSEGGVVLDVREGVFRDVAGIERGLFREGERGDLEAVEEEAGAAGVEGVGGDSAEDLSDGDPDGGAVF